MNSEKNSMISVFLRVDPTRPRGECGVVSVVLGFSISIPYIQSSEAEKQGTLVNAQTSDFSRSLMYEVSHGQQSVSK